MLMEVLITGPAKQSLKNTCAYYKSKGYTSYANKLKRGIIEKAKSLTKHHDRGQKEELLQSLERGHRYLIAETHFKIIYIVDGQRVIVTDIFDTRQSPGKLLKRNY